MQDILTQGFQLMLYGMGTVIVFLALLVVITSAMSVVVNRFFPEPKPLAPAPRGTPAPEDDPRLVAVISAAIQRHRAGSR